MRIGLLVSGSHPLRPSLASLIEASGGRGGFLFHSEKPVPLSFFWHLEPSAGTINRTPRWPVCSARRYRRSGLSGMGIGTPSVSYSLAGFPSPFFNGGRLGVTTSFLARPISSTETSK